MQNYDEDNPYLVLDEFDLRRYCIHLITINPKAVLSDLTPGFVHAKMLKLGSTGPLLDDLFQAVRIAVNLGDVPAAYKFAFLRDAFAERRSNPFFGIKAALRARAGEHEPALEDVTLLGSHDDQALVRAERFVHLVERSPDAATNELQVLLAIAGACSPAVIEMTALRVADVNPKAAIELATRIPEPSMLEEWNVTEDTPTKERCLWKIAKKASALELHEARRLSQYLHSDLEKAIVLVAAASQWLPKSPRQSIVELQLVLSMVQDETVRETLPHMFVWYILWHLPAMTEKTVFEAYQDIFDLEPLSPNRPELCRVIDLAIRRFPDKWMQWVAGMPDGYAKLFLLWRLALGGFVDVPSASPNAADAINDVLRAQNMLAEAKRNIPACITRADTLVGLAAQARAVAGIIDLVRPNDLKMAEFLALHAFESWSHVRTLDGLDASLVLLRCIIQLPSQLRTNLILWCLEISEHEKLRFMRAEIRGNLGRVLAQGMTGSMLDKAQYWEHLLKALEREIHRRMVATWLLE